MNSRHDSVKDLIKFRPYLLKLVTVGSVLTRWHFGGLGLMDGSATDLSPYLFFWKKKKTCSIEKWCWVDGWRPADTDLSLYHFLKKIKKKPKKKEKEKKGACPIGNEEKAKMNSKIYRNGRLERLSLAQLEIQDNSCRAEPLSKFMSLQCNRWTAVERPFQAPLSAKGPCNCQSPRFSCFGNKPSAITALQKILYDSYVVWF